MNTITYHNQNAPAGQEWLAQLYLPNGQKWLVHSYGATEAEAVQKITELYKAETAKHNPIYIQQIGRGERQPTDAYELGKAVATKIAIPHSGRGSHFVGKVWMIHSFTRAKIRVDQSEVDKYIAEGWIKGGPRSK